MSALPSTLIAGLSRTLNAANVSSVLWGHCLLNVHGVPSIVASVDFVISDSELDLAVKALSTEAKQLSPCDKGADCPSGSQDRCTPPPEFHMHTLDTPETTVGLFKQSDTLWFLPPLADLLPRSIGQLEPPSPFVAASDTTVIPCWRPGRGSGALDFGQQDHPVMVPRAPVLLEAFMRIYARDADKQIGSFAMAMIDYVELYVDADGLLDETQLPEQLRDFYRQLKEGEKPVSQWTRELQEALRVPANEPLDIEVDEGEGGGAGEVKEEESSGEVTTAIPYGDTETNKSRSPTPTPSIHQSPSLSEESTIPVAMHTPSTTLENDTQVLLDTT